MSRIAVPAARMHQVLRAVLLPGVAQAAVLALAAAGLLAVSLAAPALNTASAGAAAVSQETPDITWADPADIVYGTPLSGTQLNAAASVPGSFSYTPEAGTVLNAGNGRMLHVHFTPTDTLNYSEASRDVAINVSRADLAVAADNVSKTYGEADPDLTYRIVSGSLVGGDSFTGSLAREAGEDAGTYSIQPGTLALSGNYHLIFIGADGSPGGSPGTDWPGIGTPARIGPGRIYRPRFSGSIAGPSETGHHIAEYGSSSLYLYGAEEAHDPSPPYVCVTQGDLVQHLGPLTDAVNYSNRACWVDESDFLVITGGYDGSDPDIVVMRYHVGGGTISLVGAAHFGDGASRYLEMIKLQSGAIVMCWFQKAAFAETPMYFSYTRDGLDWQTVTSSVRPGYMGQYKGALCQHPADGSLWFFGHGDSFHYINGYRLVESAGSLSLDWADPTFIQGTGSSGAEMEPDPEYPGIVAIPDTAAGTILLAYQRGADHVRWYWDGTRWSLDSTGFVTYQLVSKVAVVDVQADGSCVLRTVVDQYVERVSPFGIGFLPDGRLWFVGLSCDQSRIPQRMQRLVALTIPDYDRWYLQGENDAVSDFICSDNRVLYEAGANDLCQMAWAGGNDSGGDAGTVLGTLTIAPRDITVTADAKCKNLGDADPDLTYSFNPGLVGSDNWCGALSRAAGEEAGTYAIARGTLALPGNYALTYVGASLTILPSPLTITTASPLPGATVGMAFSRTLSAAGARGHCSWSVSSGTLPAGLSLGADGVISGTPTRAGGPVYVTFRVTDGLASATASLSITVDKGTPAISWPDPADIVYGTALGGGQLAAAASMPGTFVYTPASRTVLNAGSGQTLHVDFTSADTDSYLSASAEVAINVTPLTLVVTAHDRSKTYGEAAAFTGLEFAASGLSNGDAVISVDLASAGASSAAAAGSYDIVAGGAVGTGLENYAISYVNGHLTVLKTSTLVSLLASSESDRTTDSGPVVLTAMVSGTGATGTVTFKDGEAVLGSSPLVSGAAACTALGLAPGSHLITAVYDGDANFAGGTSPAVTLAVKPAGESRGGLVAVPLAAAGIGVLLLLVVLGLSGRAWPIR